MTSSRSPILSTFVKEKLDGIKRKRFEFNLPEVYFRCTQSSFYENMINRNISLPGMEDNLLDLFCIRFGQELYNSNFYSESWRELLNQIHSPYLSDRIASEYNKTHSYQKSKTRFMSDDDDVVKYYYPIYKTLLVDFDCRIWFSNLDIDKLVRNLKEAFSESSIKVNAVVKAPSYPEQQIAEIKQLCNTFIIDREILCRSKPADEKDIPGYCKQMIILHYKFIMNYEKLVAEIIG